MKQLLLSVGVALAAAGSLCIPAFAEEAEKVVAGEFTLSFPEPWKQKPSTSSMRLAEFTYDHKDEALADVDLVVFHFPNQGGGTRANLDRWIGQFEGEPKVEEENLEFDGKRVVILKASGTYMESSGGPFSGNKTARPDYTLLAAVLESDRGPVFLKLYGPSASVEAMSEAFKKVAASPFG